MFKKNSKAKAEVKKDEKRPPASPPRRATPRPPETTSKGSSSKPAPAKDTVKRLPNGNVDASVDRYSKADLGAMSDRQLIDHYKRAKADPSHQDKMGYADNKKMKDIHDALALRSMTPEAVDRGKITFDRTDKASGSSTVPARDAKGRVDTSKPLKDVPFKGKGNENQPKRPSRPPK
jgi:hypothetical protein